MTTLEVSDAMLNEIITTMPTVFDSHAVIRELMTTYPREYVSALHVHVANQDPILTFHATIGTRLAGLTTIARTRRISSPNVRGQSTENQEWRKN